MKRATRKALEPGPQAPRGTWTPAELSAAIRRGTLEEKVALLKKIGILDENGEVAEKYRSWGSKVSRTMVWREGEDAE
ncbi:MAG TPA: hypothetical protein VLS89_15680 [Candidatus Nanopelagicales bacterium]|nr:hypothetical protein [Candidatus Nanopelagicales bacterium]